MADADVERELTKTKARDLTDLQLLDEYKRLQGEIEDAHITNWDLWSVLVTKKLIIEVEAAERFFKDLTG